MDQPSQGALFRREQDDRRQVHLLLLEHSCGWQVAMLKGAYAVALKATAKGMY
jgi:hypothetical protein